jgi:hypothetical protein
MLRFTFPLFISAISFSTVLGQPSPCGQVKPAQCKFWQELFDSTGGTPPYSGAPSKWKNCFNLRDDPCECGGRTCPHPTAEICVTCKNGDITAMNLEGNGLNGTIPSSISELTGLTYLGLDENAIKGTISSSIGELTSLTELHLDRNQLTGSIPSAVAKLTGLTMLMLHYNKLTGGIPSELADLKALTRLYLAQNKLTGRVPPLPFEQYNGGETGGTECWLNAPSGLEPNPNPYACTEPECNHFSCPLPANSNKCKYFGGDAGVHCK